MRQFPGDPQTNYLLIIQDDGERDTRAVVKLNGETIVKEAALRGLEVRELQVALPLRQQNQLTVLPQGRVGAKVMVWVQSAEPSALSFDGVNDYVLVPSAPVFNVPLLTAEAWINLSQEVDSQQARIINRQSAPGGGKAWGLEIFGRGYEGSTGNELVFHSSNCNVNRRLRTGVKLQTGFWYHVAGVNDGTTLSVYLNGTLVASSPSNGFQCSAVNAPIVIGRIGGGNTLNFPGTIDEVQLWGVARSQVEIQQDMLGGVSPASSGLLGYWRFDEGEGTTAHDATNNGNDGRLVNGPVWLPQTWDAQNPGAFLPAWCGVSADFAGNRIPPGWSTFILGSSAGVRNDRLESTDFNSAIRVDVPGALPSQIQEIEIQYDGNNDPVPLANIGMGRFISLPVPGGFIEPQEFNDRFGARTLTFRAQLSLLQYPTPSSTVLFLLDHFPITYGVRHFTAVIRDSQVTWTAVAIGDGFTIGPFNQPLTGFTLSQVQGFSLGVGAEFATASGAGLAWADNLSVSCR